MTKLNCVRGFPHIIKRIKALWGSPECDLYISQLLIPERNRNEGFPAEAFKELSDILDVHRLLYAKCDKPGCCSGKEVVASGPYRW